MSHASRLIATSACADDASPGGIVATATRYLAHAAPSATGMTIISPDGTARYISRAQAEQAVFGSKLTDTKATT